MILRSTELDDKLGIGEATSSVSRDPGRIDLSLIEAPFGIVGDHVSRQRVERYRGTSLRLRRDGQKHRTDEGREEKGTHIIIPIDEVSHSLDQCSLCSRLNPRSEKGAGWERSPETNRVSIRQISALRSRLERRRRDPVDSSVAEVGNLKSITHAPHGTSGLRSACPQRRLIGTGRGGCLARTFMRCC